MLSDLKNVSYILKIPHSKLSIFHMIDKYNSLYYFELDNIC